MIPSVLVSGCKAAIITRVGAAWGKFRELLSVLSCKSLPLRAQVRVYGNCFRATMLNASECWTSRKIDMTRLGRIEWVMLRWIFGLKFDDSTSIGVICTKLKIFGLKAAIGCVVRPYAEVIMLVCH